MSTEDATPADAPVGLAARIADDIAALDRELAEIDMLVGQARVEGGRHEQKRAAAEDKARALEGKPESTAMAEAYGQLVTLTRRATLMESQVDLLEGKRRAIQRHRDALTALAEALGAGVSGDPGPDGDEHGEEALPPSLSRAVLGAQEDLRREIARAMHDGPAQSLTNIVLQAQIVERLVDRDPTLARNEVKLLVSMVQQTLDATKNFIFDVRPMVLDDLGLVPTLRRVARDRGRRAHVAVAFDSLGQDRRLAVDVETSVFRILDEGLSAYLSAAPDEVHLRLEWSDARLEARLSASRSVTIPPDAQPVPEETAGDVPAALAQMIEDRRSARDAAVEAAHAAAIVTLPAATRREVGERAAMIGATLEILGGGAELRLVVELGGPAGAAPEAAAPA